MTSEKNGGPAFPSEYKHPPYSGMSLRDWFAGRALTGLLMDPSRGALVMSMESYCVWSFALADAMLAERERAA